ncbi:MAG: CCA tRNA nucleotidyltransferase [Faecalicoccus sp.]|uniref:CCA tRNA nucleotidyltransferase n=1 Tax=Faecalicoccus sp. TaxID=1971758 RepID=UPI002F940524
MNDKLPKNVKQTLLLLKQAGFEAFLVGGAVRDLLMNKNPKDYDLATNATPEQMENVFCDYHCIRTGMRHNTITVHIQNDFIEITTYRNQSGTIQEDLACRDITINAMAFSLQDGLVDPYGGFDDLQAKLLRFTGNGLDRIREDPLRMLRMIRFACQLDFSIDFHAWQLIQINSSLLDQVSRERIRDELDKILFSDSNGLDMLYESGLLETIDSHLSELFLCEQKNPYHYTDVGHHTLDALRNVLIFVPVVSHEMLSAFEEKTIRYALLLHDIGKPSVKTTDTNGVDHFYGHAEVSVKLARHFLTTYRFSNAEIERILKLVQYHDYHLSMTYKGMRKMLVKHHLYPEFMKSLLIVKLCDASAHRHPEKMIPDLLDFKTFYMDFIQNHPYRFSDLKIDGHTILTLCPNIDPKKIPVIQQECLDQIMQHSEKNTKEELSCFIKKNQRRYRVMNLERK